MTEVLNHTGQLKRADAANNDDYQDCARLRWSEKQVQVSY
jgi:hypothetical protein